MKYELGGEITKKFLGLRAKSFNYLIGGGSEDNKANGTKNRVIKRKLKLEDYKKYLEAAQLENKRKHPKKH